MKKICLFILFLGSIRAWAQMPSFAWAKAMGNSANDGGFSVKTDAAGNVYTTGYFSGTVDFDPGAGTYTLTSTGISDVFIQKLDASGNFVWAKSVGSTGAEYGYGITLDASGNIYIAGRFENTVDFDPGPGTFTLSSAGTADIFVLKLNAAGNFVWADRMGSTSLDVAYSITIDGSGNVCTTGEFIGTVDFDPGPGTYTLASVGGGYDIFVQKLDANGNFIWARAMGGTGADFGQSIVTDAAGNIYTAGHFSTTADFDPGAGTYSLTSVVGPDIFVQKMDANGNFVWAKGMGSTSNDYGYGIALDGPGNIYVTGSFIGTVDFDPGPGTSTLTSAGNNEIFVLKLDGGGNFLWAKNMGSAMSDVGNGIATDASGNVYTTGEFNGTADFDPGPGTFTITSLGSIDIFISKLDASGNFVWAAAVGSTLGDRGWGISVDGSGRIYTTGTFYASADFDIGPGVFNLNPLGNGDVFVQKLLPCSSAPVQPSAISGATSVCTGSTASNYSVTTVVGAISYSWTLPGGWSGSSSTNTISAAPGSTGIFSVAAVNACGTSAQQTLNVTVITCSASSLAEGMTASTGLSIYPNPAGNFIYLVSGSGSSSAVEVLNALGQVVLRSTMADGVTTINISEFESGIYMVRTGTVVKKIVKE